MSLLTVDCPGCRREVPDALAVDVRTPYGAVSMCQGCAPTGARRARE